MCARKFFNLCTYHILVADFGKIFSSPGVILGMEKTLIVLMVISDISGHEKSVPESCPRCF